MSAIPQDPISTDLPCAKCRYNLRTLSPNSICPECATPVADTIAHYTTPAPYRFHFLFPGSILLILFSTTRLTSSFLPVRPRWLLEILALGFPALCLGAILAALSNRTRLTIRRKCAIAIVCLMVACDIAFVVEAHLHPINLAPTGGQIPWPNLVLRDIFAFLEAMLCCAAWPFVGTFARTHNASSLRIVAWIYVPLITLGALWSVATALFVEPVFWKNITRNIFTAPVVPAWYEQMIAASRWVFPVTYVALPLLWSAIAVAAWKMHRSRKIPASLHAALTRSP